VANEGKLKMPHVVYDILATRLYIPKQISLVQKLWEKFLTGRKPDEKFCPFRETSTSTNKMNVLEFYV